MGPGSHGSVKAPIRTRRSPHGGRGAFGGTCVGDLRLLLPKLRDCLRDVVFEVKVPEDVGERARVPIERMVAIS
jgi:quinolinate synthase